MASISPTGASTGHCVVPGGGLSADHSRWIHSRRSFFLPVRVLSRVFRGKFVAGLKQLFRRNKLEFFGTRQQFSEAKAFKRFPPYTVSRGLGRLRQAAVLWTRACVALPGTVHPSRRYLQSQIAERH